MVSQELHAERLGTTNADGSRAFVYPADVRGPWRSRRTLVHAVLLTVLLVVPWLKVHGEQLFLLDFAKLHFVVFGKLFGAHDAPILFLVVAGFVFSLLTVTALWGRIWCGWACPQTVFVDGVFRRVERWIEGSHLERRKRDSEGASVEKALRKGAKWAVFTLVSLLIAHSVLAYFVGADALVAMMRASPEKNAHYFILVIAVTGVLLFDLGWFREQFCVIACPYGRFQSVLMDAQTTTINYDAKRGEPRKGARVEETPRGDCVSCLRCVRVCPTGIDIRRGVQMECINCTACVDACDEVMTKIGKPKGLIRYASQAALDGAPPSSRLRPRAFLYAAGIVATWGAFIFIFFTRGDLDTVVLRAKGEPFSVSSADGTEFVINHFQIELSSRVRWELALSFDLAPAASGSGASLITPFRPLSIPPGAIVRAELFIRFPKSMLRNGAAHVDFEIKASGDLARPHREELTLVGPYS